METHIETTKPDEGLAMAHYYAMQAILDLYENVEECVYMAQYHKKLITLSDMEEVKVSLQRILSNFGSA